MPAEDYVKWLRSRVGKDVLIVNYSGGWIENNEGEVLLQNRSPDQERWGFPGGAMNIGETAQDTAIREIKEETGLDVSIERFIGVYTCNMEDIENGDRVHSIVFFFRMNINGGILTCDMKETYDLKFFNKHNFPIMYNKLHSQIFKDVILGKSGICV